MIFTKAHFTFKAINRLIIIMCLTVNTQLLAECICILND